ncbi:MAG TPA: FAD-binding oxidoreductase [Parvibaculum sp.]|uniref:NAD(P)/FAD-dependent oxidoreductase n=1 Tax=Parvibaculum sp. TaxID=2024848 RepID=UPI002B768A58|nr:FAD-binding oxidoreductase [Parvibaculum sp.]HMM14288.1 FAD-binding oxidoreductase [Parvibaculum sp.]
MPAQDYPSSYYVATAKGVPALGPLNGDETADVCVIGAGFTGLSAALHLAERGYSVTVIEAERVGWGASGRNGGQLGSGHRKDQRTLEEKLGLEWAHRLWSLAADGLATVKDLIARYEIDCDLKPGVLHAAWKHGEAAWFQDEVDHMAREYGYHMLRFVPREEMREMVDTERYHAGMLDMGGAHLHPLNFCLGLARGALAKGVRIYEHTPALDISRADPARVRTPNGTVMARHVILACNAYLGSLAPDIAGRIMPVNNFIVATEPLGEARARSLIRDDVGVQDTKFVIDYYRLSADGRMLFGGGENYSGRLPSNIAAFVRKPMLRVFPQLADVRIDYAWSGTLAITMSRIPDFGRLAPNILYAQGFSGQGLNIATLAGKLMAEAIAGQAERFDWMADVRVPNFPGGTLLRYPGLIAGVLWYTLKDRLP